jgi:hypothetical protein
MTARPMIACLLAVACALALCCCVSRSRDRLAAPRTLVAPYDTSRGQALWAVAPVRNESGTSLIDLGAVGDKVAAAIEETQGIRCAPLNRSLEAMRSLGLPAIRTPGDARRLAQAMGVDGVVVVTITAWDPYAPKIGLAAALYASPTWLAAGREPLDPRALQASPTVSTPAGPRHADLPTATASELLDGKNHQVLMDLEAYATGRMNGPSAMGWRRYLRSMDLFTEFASYRVMDGLMREEWVRTGVASGRADGGR